MKMFPAAIPSVDKKDSRIEEGKVVEQSDNKRQLCDESGSGEAPARKRQKLNSCLDKDINSNAILDICKELKINAGSRLEMKWKVHKDENEAPIVHWWGATVLEWDGRLHTLTDEASEEDDEKKGDEQTVPLRKLRYDEFPKGGFPSSSTVESVFLSDHLLYDLEQEQEIPFRIAGSDWEEPDDANQCEKDELIPVDNLEEHLRLILEKVIQTALTNPAIADKMTKLDPARQCAMADKVCNVKENLLKKMLGKLQGDDKLLNCVITPDFVKECMSELSETLQL